MGYTDDDSMVRVDFFKPSGKWYTTEAVEWTGGWQGKIPIHVAFAKSLNDHFQGERLSDMDAICLVPYHENEHPICIRQGGWLNHKE